MYLLLISATGDLCVLKDFLGNPVNPLRLRQRFPDPPLKANEDWVGKGGLGGPWGWWWVLLPRGQGLEVLELMLGGRCCCLCGVFHA